MESGRLREDTAEILEDGEDEGCDTTEQSIRKAYVRKVYSILTCQLLTMFSFISVFMYCEPAQRWAMEPASLALLLVALVAVTACLLVMACCEGVHRASPVNFVFLGVFTIAGSFLLGFTACFFSDAVMLAVGITAAVCLALTLFAFQTKWDFTTQRGMLLCAFVVLLHFAVIAISAPDKILHLVYASLGALLLSGYLVYVTRS